MDRLVFDAVRTCLNKEVYDLGRRSDHQFILFATVSSSPIGLGR